MDFKINDAVLSLMEGDITKVAAVAIVNAANSRLAGGGGVDGAIHRAGGPSIMEELDTIRSETGRCATGDAVVTGAGRLPAKYVIHAVGPVYQDGRHQEPEKLASCYETSLRIAQEKGAKTVSFPSISTGAYGYPIDEAAEVALRTVAAFLRKPGCSIEKATFVLFGAEAHQAYVKAAEQAFGR